jgi:hypothetical protein
MLREKIYGETSQMTINRQKFMSLFLIAGLFLSSILSYQAVADEVILKKVDSFDPIIKELNKADPDTLVVFDVDYVLIVPKDLIARPASRELRHTLFPKIEQEVGQDKFKYLSSIMRSQGVGELVDDRLPGLIKELQDRSVKVIALTAQGYGPFGVIKDEGTLRVEELKKLDLDFSQSFPSLERFTLNIPSPKDQLPLYRDGIIFTDRSSKGEALIAFLQRVKWTPKQIIVIDDGRQHLEHIQEALKANHLNGLLFLYIDGKLAVEKPDPDLAQTQFDYLIKNEKWLSDEEARKLSHCNFQNNPHINE